ncbi:FG-GAP-like repeat-containing protein [Flavobacterium pectinovorum]|uniref:Teneurin-like YD-shell domain-containing protein n=1 Tax=Flavobacterium pectinovorum TaxID=29533 RepID=A0A502EGE8_9FLAO|nr:FG-GAP-like repeat-containing protein [Flavobacterium pectinovorum]TPG35401.1 hypothetical protein EAH81_21830 [Flavobacterium pectinovorum]
MKQFYISFLFISFSLFLSAQSTEVGSTPGELSVSLSGAATYNLPIAVPPGINGVVPQISLAYNSQSGSGNAGYGWNIAGISTIGRIASTKFHDGVIDPVDFDNLDRFTLDGQRLIVKNGTIGAYGANLTVYETESFSNVKITSYGVHPNGANYGPAYFIVEYPDGSKANYGNSTDSRSITDWAITYWENPQGVRISYNYSLTNNILDITSVKYGTLTNITPINEIKFNYGPRGRSEQSYIGGQSLSKTKILSSINVIGNGVGFRNYFLDYISSQLDYQRLSRITEKNGDNSKSYNPTTFDYSTSTETVLQKNSISSVGLGQINANNSQIVSGDFDGDAKMDFILYPTTGVNTKKDFWMFTKVDQTSLNFPLKGATGYFGDAFASTGLTSNGKFFPYQGITLVQGDTDPNAINFNTYYKSSNGVTLENTKKAVFPERSISDCYDSKNVTLEKTFLSGDFNGDGLTDVIAIDKEVQEWFCFDDRDGYPAQSYATNITMYLYFVDLDRRKTTNFVNFAGALKDYYLTTGRIETFDVNGDGKTDILHFKNGMVTVYTLDNNNQLELLWQMSDPDIKITQSILSGDYNGDGKMDFIIPKSTGLYATDYVNFISKGNGFEKTPRTYTFSNLGYSEDSQAIYTSTLIPLDINADGKTDIVQFRSIYQKSSGTGTATITIFKNKESSFVASSIPTYQTASSSNIKSYPIPIFLSPKTNNQYLSVGLISDSQMYTFDSQNDVSKELLIKSVTNGNLVKQSITYSPLQQDQYEPFYSPTIFTETFPNIDIIAAPNFKIVTKLEQQSVGGGYKKQLFNYSGAVSNANGIGFLGFRATMRTNWHNDTTSLISTVSKNNIDLRGANVENFSVLDDQVPTDSTPTVFISRSTLNYNTAADALQSNKVFKLKNTSLNEFNGLDGTTKTVTTVYDKFNNPLTITTELKENGITNPIQTSITKIDYKTENASPYYVGVPSSKNLDVSVTGSRMLSEEVYEYNNTTYGLLTKISKKADITTNYIDEKNDYDGFGNITKKTITITGLTPRITSYVYDTSGRFLIKSTDIEGLFKTFDYNLSSGVLKSEVNQNGLTTSYEYDSWFKKTKTIDYLDKSNNHVYSRSAEKTLITNTGDDGSNSEETFDDLGRKTKRKTKDISGNFTSTDYLYDIYDRNYKVSEPYSGASPTQFSETQYDEYGRLKKSISFTGKTTDVKYLGLTTTVSDSLKTTVSIRNAVGKIISMTDTPGGTITYTYFANGNLNTTLYGTSKTEILQDAWGRKKELRDPSAGTYKYEYNDLGEITKEETPAGYTMYKLNAFGKLDEKKIVMGTNDTISRTKYSYDPTTKLLLKSEFTDKKNTSTITDVYTYDSSKRIIKTVETGLYSTFTKRYSYDAFGRTDTITSIAKAGVKTSSQKIVNTYKNGSHWQILDGITNAVLWQNTAVNARGQVTSAQSGPMTITNTYDSYGYISQAKFDKTTPLTNILTLNTAFNTKTGNLSSRSNTLFGRNETFKYDSLDRLTDYTNKLGVLETQTYDDRGRITQNSVGTYEYDSLNPYRNKAIAVTPEALGYYSMREGIFNDSMEDRIGWGPNTAFYSYDNTTVAHTGKNSLKLANTLTTEQFVFSDKWVDIDNTIATQYTYSAWFKSDNPQAEIFLYMKDAANVVTQVNTINNTKGAWTQITGTFTVPATVKKLRLRLDNNGLGNIWFDDVQIRKTSDLATTTRALNVTYNTFKSPIEIEETGVDKISFTYNDGNDRSSMFYGGQQTNKLQRTYFKHYSADGTMEIKQNTVTGAVEFITYIGGDGYTAPIAAKSDGINPSNYLYLARDYQGTIVAIVDQTGAIVEKRLFDAWGTIVKVQDGAGNILSGLTVLDRGYTGHEHLQSIGIIHMNGRLYDPKLHRFMQPDNFVQDPFNTQNYNRYGYCWNNPLRYNDASGEWVHIVIGAVIGGVINWGVHGFRMDMEGLKAFGIGAGAGALGAATGGAAFGLAGGASAGAGGALAGAFSGGIGTLSSSLFLSFGNHAAFGDPLMSGKDMIKGVAFGMLTGGVINGVTALAYGKTFWTGATIKVAVQPITLPQTAGLAELDNANNIKTGDYKISSSTEPTTAATFQNNTATNIDIDNGYVDLSNRPEFNTIGSTGKVGEDALKLLGGESQHYAKTTLGGRYIDQLVEGVGNESKVGYTSLTKTISLQIAKDVELINTNQIKGATWYFFRSPVTGKIGASQPLLDALEKYGIKAIINE